MPKAMSSQGRPGALALQLFLTACFVSGGSAQTLTWASPNEKKFINGQLTTSPFAFQPGSTLGGAQMCLQPSSGGSALIVSNPCVTPVSGDYGALVDKWTFNFTDNSVRTWNTPNRQPDLCLEGGSLTLAPGSGFVVNQITAAPCNASVPTQKWEWDDAFLKVLDNNRWLSPAPDQSGHFQLGVNKQAAVPVNFVLPPYTLTDTYTFQPTLAHSGSQADSADPSDIGDGPGPCQYGVHRAGTFYTSVDCATQCDREPKCRGFTFGVSGGIGCCYLKVYFPAAQSTATSGYSTYVKGTSDEPWFPALALPSSLAAAESMQKESSKNLGAILGGLCGGGAVILVALCCCVFCLYQRKKRRSKNPELEEGARTQPQKLLLRLKVPEAIGAGTDPGPPGRGAADIDGALGPTWRAFSYHELRRATSDFATGNVLGEGAFGRVYRGVLPDRARVAVKQLKAGPKGFSRRDFLDELRALSAVRHRHLAALRGYCAVQNEQYFLVFDLADGGNLARALHERKVGVLSWEARVRIAVAAAGGLAYLHNDTDPPIIHRDIKSANILLDSKKIAQVADFGLARLMDDGDVGMTIQARGTYGYVAPEYVQEGLISKKLDVYSFGVVLLELLTGLHAMHQSAQGTRRSLVGVVLVQFPGVDPRLNGKYRPVQATQLYKIAMACVVRHENRPDMGAVLRALQDLEQGPGARPGPINRALQDGAAVGSPVTPAWAGISASRSNFSSEVTDPRGASGFSASTGSEATGEFTVTSIVTGR